MIGNVSPYAPERACHLVQVLDDRHDKTMAYLGRFSLLRIGAHLLAALSTAPAGLRTTLHLPVGILVGLAHHGTGLTNLRALCADVMVVRRAAAHEIRGNRADLGAVHQGDQMLGFRVPAAVIKYMDSGGSANLVAIEAGLDAVSVRVVDGHGRLL